MRRKNLIVSNNLAQYVQLLGALPCIWKKAVCFETQGKISAGILPSNHKKRLGVVLEKDFESFTPVAFAALWSTYPSFLQVLLCMLFHHTGQRSVENLDL